MSLALLRRSRTIVLTLFLCVCALVNTACPPPPIDETFDIPYAEFPDTDPNLTSLDIYAPDAADEADLDTAAPTLHPIVVYVHGGVWHTGDKRNVDYKPGAFVRNGYVFISINHRLSPHVQHPSHVQDVAAAIAWIRDHAREYGGDPERIFLLGHSSGAHLAALVATDERHLNGFGADLSDLSGVILVDGAAYDIPLLLALEEPTSRTRIAMVFGLNGEVYEDASPINHVAPNKGIPPFLLIRCAQREASDVQADYMARALRAAGVYAQIYMAPLSTHTSINRFIGAFGDSATQKIFQFLARHGGNPSDFRIVPGGPVFEYYFVK